MDLQTLLPVWPLQNTTLTMIALAFVVAAISGELTQRWLHLPRITGYSLAGLLAGPGLLNWIGAAQIDGLRVFIDLTLALLLFELGIRVDLGWLHKNPVIFAISLAEALLTFITTFLVMTVLGYALQIALVVATISISTSPVVVMRMVSELRARGQVTERLLLLTALNLIYTVLLTHLLLAYLHQDIGHSWSVTLLHPLYLLCGSLMMGALLASAFRLLRPYLEPAREQASAVLFGMLLLFVALLQMTNLPILLAPLLAGILVRKLDPRPHSWPQHFGTVGSLLVIVLFIVTGASLSWDMVLTGGQVALLLIAARLAGKICGVVTLGHWSGMSWRQGMALGVALCPMSGVAIVLSADIVRLHPAIGATVSAIVLSMVAILELLGPIALQWSLTLSKETAVNAGRTAG